MSDLKFACWCWKYNISKNIRTRFIGTPPEALNGRCMKCGGKSDETK